MGNALRGGEEDTPWGPAGILEYRAVMDMLTKQGRKLEEVWSVQNSRRWIQLIPKVEQYGGFGKSSGDKMTRRRFWERAIFFLQKFDRRGLGRRKTKICSVIVGFWHEDGEQVWKRKMNVGEEGTMSKNDSYGGYGREKSELKQKWSWDCFGLWIKTVVWEDARRCSVTGELAG